MHASPDFPWTLGKVTLEEAHEVVALSGAQGILASFDDRGRSRACAG
jgi:hypothetical protein